MQPHNFTSILIILSNITVIHSGQYYSPFAEPNWLHQTKQDPSSRGRQIHYKMVQTLKCLALRHPFYPRRRYLALRTARPLAHMATSTPADTTTANSAQWSIVSRDPVSVAMLTWDGCCDSRARDPVPSRLSAIVPRTTAWDCIMHRSSCCQLCATNY